MTKAELTLFEFLKEGLRVEVLDDSTPATCGGDVSGSTGVRVQLWLRDPTTGRPEMISESRVTLN